MLQLRKKSPPGPRFDRHPKRGERGRWDLGGEDGGKVALPPRGSLWLTVSSTSSTERLKGYRLRAKSSIKLMLMYYVSK